MLRAVMHASEGNPGAKHRELRAANRAAREAKLAAREAKREAILKRMREALRDPPKKYCKNYVRFSESPTMKALARLKEEVKAMYSKKLPKMG